MRATLTHPMTHLEHACHVDVHVKMPCPCWMLMSMMLRLS